VLELGQSAAKLNQGECSETMEKQLIALNGHECNGAIIGMTLGDSHLRRSSPTANTSMQTKHEIDCRDYLEWKRHFFSPYFSGEIKPEFQKGDGGKWKDRWSVRWHTECSKRLNYHHQDFYPHGKKIIKKSVLNRLSPLGLALLYGDDGCLHVADGYFKALDIYTDGFDSQSVGIIVDWFKEVLGFSFVRDSKRDYISSDTASGLRFLAIVKPFIDQIPSLRHKSDITRFGLQSSIAFKALPINIQNRLLGRDVSILPRGYVWQHFSKSALWPERICAACGEITHRKLSQYCSPRCYQAHWARQRKSMK
jgi:hypothetical protein